MIEYLLHAPDRTTLLATLVAIDLPGGMGKVMTLDPETGEPIPHEWVRMDEIGPITKTPATYDAEGNELTPAVVVGGHHVNCVAIGPLADALTAGLAQVDENGDPLGLFARTHILDLLGAMEWQEITEDGVPAGYQGTSGIRIFDPATLNSRYRVWQ